ncbi:hypothetical protein Pyn_19606 [Prunus yedoensis var. nudiflora]|uniref:Uncharacterized protein n=1 Tax=Prunus yedoensis var. nudiflora TaxID=2094558 RepID=A0A314UVQ8_PRUYE|nr:hypothetical protein Pyn_19606 [Prunus yedoensis var. nudiflora]
METPIEETDQFFAVAPWDEIPLEVKAESIKLVEQQTHDVGVELTQSESAIFEVVEVDNSLAIVQLEQ